MHAVLEKISTLGVVPVIAINDVEKAVPLAKALCEGGLPCAEITFRTAEAEESIKRITQAFPDMLVGAGTVLTTEQVDRAVAAGAKFIVSPGLNPKTVAYCVSKGIPITPGVSSASDIEVAIELGLEVVKFFPAEAIGGLKAIKSLAAPYVNTKFMPTGGINAKNINEYLAFEKIIACGGSWMVDPALLNAGEFDKIRELTAEAVRTTLGFELGHIGINAANAKEAEGVARMFCTVFGMEYRDGNSSIFAGKAVEVMKEPYLGKNGHIAIVTNSVKRAVAYMESKGVAINQASLKLDAKGNPLAVYLQEEFGGFAVHLLQKK